MWHCATMSAIVEVTAEVLQEIECHIIRLVLYYVCITLVNAELDSPSVVVKSVCAHQAC